MCCDEKEEKICQLGCSELNTHTHMRTNLWNFEKQFIFTSVHVCAYMCLWVPVKVRRGFLITWNKRHGCL